MAITADSLRWYQSERMTDEDDGGGRMTANEIVWGDENQVFDDISDVDRAAGDVSIRKVYASVNSNDADKYLDAGVVVLRPPADPDVSVVAFSTGDYYDERADLADRLESQVVRGAVWQAWLWGDHVIGQKAVTFWQRMSYELPAIGQRLELVKRESSVTTATQMLWITRVTEQTVERVDGVGPYQVRMVTCEIAEALRDDFKGVEPQRTDPTTQGTNGTLVYETRYNPGAINVVGAVPLSAQAELGDYTVKVDSLYQPLIPTAFAESALADINPGGDSASLFAGRSSGTIAWTTTLDCMKPGAQMFLGGPVFPGTLTITYSGTNTTDDGGKLMRSGVEIGTINYSSGICTWNSACPNTSTSTKTVAYRPAGVPTRVAETAFLEVTVENRGFVWVLTLAPIPAPESLRVAYRVNNEWYLLLERGDGTLSGADSSYGSGTLSYETGTVTVTTGALPDPDSLILFSWGTPSNYFAHGGEVVDPVKLSGTLANPGVAPGTVSVTWSGGSLTDSGMNGVLSGTGGSGTIKYRTGEWEITPTTVPAQGAVFSWEYDYGDPVEEVFAHPSRDGEGKLLITLDQVPRAGSVEVEWNVLIHDYEVFSSVERTMPIEDLVDPILTCFDSGSGTFDIPGGTDGDINYASRTLHWLPDITTSIPKPVYDTTQFGHRTFAEGNQGRQVFYYKTVMTGVSYVDALASYPLDESGYVKVRYRPAGGDTTATEDSTVASLVLDLTKKYSERIVPGSARFLLGNSAYVDTAGVLYRDPSPATGAGSLAGTLDRNSGRAQINSWVSGGANAVPLQGLVTEVGGQPIDEVVFRTPASPIKPGALQIRFQPLSAQAPVAKTIDQTGHLTDGDCVVAVDYDRGQISIRFGYYKAVADLTEAEMAEQWYDPTHAEDIGGVSKMWIPRPVYADSIFYNAVATTMLPPDSTLLGLDAARLPPDGQALLFQTGMLCLVHHTGALAPQSLSAGQTIDCGRTRLYRVVIEDSLGARLPSDLYTVDRTAGTLTMTTPLDLSDYTGPYSVYHTIADLLRLRDTDINGNLTFLRPVSHDFVSGYVSGMLYLGTLQARVAKKFEQTTWTGVWQDTRIGDQPLASYNDAAYPIAVTNAGAYKDRILIKFTNSTAFQVIGEQLGLIGVGDINNDCAPINPLTGLPYFTIDYRGWGGGWATGNCLRFNLEAASYPIDVVRAIQPSAPTGQSDSVELLLVGNVDA
jgi:hypothetical protein